MAGHSHAANIAHRKGLVDAKRGKLFSKLCRAIYVAARAGGPDPVTNLRLRYAIDKARAVSCPKENIERSIKKATGELGAENYEEIIYEGYGPSGVAVMCEILTDNRNRTASEVRRIFEISGGSLGSTGCVSYLFHYKGFFLVPVKSIEEDRLMEVALESGAEDIQPGDEFYEITCEPKSFDELRKALEDARIVTEVAETRHLPSNTVELDAESARKMLRLRDLLDENDDVQNIYSNEMIPESVLAEIS
ncbi:MAG: hypothetical protein RJA81_506 [Planctomycetota bacterium]